ncbi:hypothetical protein [Tsukamurella pseudospumae]|nr:hypothetical protein [Tsukamurella pseudospumae]
MKVITDLESDTHSRVYLIELSPDGAVIERELFASHRASAWSGTWYSGSDNDGRRTIEVTVFNRYFGTVRRVNDDLFVGTEVGPRVENDVETRSMTVNARFALVRVNADGTGPDGTLV